MAETSRLFPSLAVLSAVAALLLSTPTGATAQSDLPRVSIATELGEFVVEVDTLRAPVTGGNFLRYVDGGFYDGGSFHRTVTADNQPNDSVKIAVIQGNVSRARRLEAFGPIPLERTNLTGIRHLHGAISMARDGPDTAVASFFICVGDQPELDFGGRRNSDGQGFAAFGKVVSGTEVVRRIHGSPAQGQALSPEVMIFSAKRIDAGSG
jgi:peptidyl-prolyl cis-trans isomerase A (cyclophilin A)